MAINFRKLKSQIKSFKPQVAGQVIYLLLLIRLMFVGLYGTAWLLSLFLFFSSFGLMALSG